MNRITKRFDELAKLSEKALVCFLTCGDPDLQTTKELVMEIAKNGADIVELGIPFSDPLADGPSIQSASLRALEAGTTLAKVLDCVKEIRKESDVPIVLMSYFNPINKYGLERFAKDAAGSGADGVIITDLIPEEADEWKKIADNVDLSTIFLLAPTSTKDRIALGANTVSGFVYCVSRTGVTGARSDIPIELKKLVAEIKLASALPVAVGFGISTPDHVRQVCEYADGAVVGSALVSLIASKIAVSKKEAIEAAGVFVKQLKEATISGK